MPELWNAILQFKYTPLIAMGLAIIGVVIFYQVIMRRIQRFATQRAYKAENAQTFFFVSRYVFMFTVVVGMIFLFGDTIGILGLTLGFVMTLLGWGIRNPIMNLAGWLMIVLRKPFRIGDRVILGGLIGDVKDISITYTLLDQVGGTVGGEERSGRSVMIPNLHLFRWTIINYTLDEKYILDEVPIRLTYDSDIERAEEIMLRHGNEITADVIRETGESAFVRFAMIPSGVIARLRYRVLAPERQKISTLIVERIFEEFARTEGIRFAHVKSDVQLNAREEQPAPPQSPQWLM